MTSAELFDIAPSQRSFNIARNLVISIRLQKDPEYFILSDKYRWLISLENIGSNFMAMYQTLDSQNQALLMRYLMESGNESTVKEIIDRYEN